LRNPAVASERIGGGDLKTHLISAGHKRHERNRGVAVSRNCATQIDIYLLTIGYQPDRAFECRIQAYRGSGNAYHPLPDEVSSRIRIYRCSAVAYTAARAG